jgi:hypothetical protein
VTAARPGQAARQRADWWSRTSLRLHLTLVVGLAGCAVAATIEWERALSGHVISWVYAFEWPLFAVFGSWVWWRLVHETAPRAARRKRRPPRRSGSTPSLDDPQLVAWQDYLARLHAADPPGGPPSRMSSDRTLR